MITTMDVVYACKRQARALYGFCGRRGGYNRDGGVWLGPWETSQGVITFINARSSARICDFYMDFVSSFGCVRGEMVDEEFP